MMQVMIDLEKVGAIDKWIKIISNPVRISILNILLNEKTKINQQEIITELKAAPGITSVHLKILRDGGMIIPQREKGKVFYTINKENLNKYLKNIDEIYKLISLKLYQK